VIDKLPSANMCSQILRTEGNGFGLAVSSNWGNEGMREEGRFSRSSAMGADENC
jgi:hypothetical protein